MTNTENNPDSIISSTDIADALDNLEALLRVHRDYLNGAGDPLSGLREMHWIESNLNDLRQGLVDFARFNGETWADIGEALGVSRQAAHERFNS